MKQVLAKSFNVKTFNFIKKPLSEADSKERHKVVKLSDHSFNLQSTFHHILICIVLAKDQHKTNVKTFMHTKFDSVITLQRGVQKKSAKILTMEGKTVKTQKRTKSVKKKGEKCHFV